MIDLRKRTRDHVIEFWYSTQDEEIERLFPRSIETLNEALRLFEVSQKEGAISFGQVIYVDGKYVGDVWLFGIDENDEKMGMLSIVIFDKDYWDRGMGTEAIREFSKTCFSKYTIDKVGAFTYVYNTRSIKALEKAGFAKIESFVEDGVESYYLEISRG